MRLGLIVLALTSAAPALAQQDPLCWAPPAAQLKKDGLERLSRAMNGASQTARPEHTDREVLELPSASSAKTAALECVMVVVTELAFDASGWWTLTLRLKDGDAREIASSVVTVDPKKAGPADLSAAWAQFWVHADPPPKPKAPPAPAVEQVVDADLAVERKTAAAPRPVVSSPRRARIALASGFNLRSVAGPPSPAGVPGTSLEGGAVLSIGGEATLFGGSWLGAPHALDLTVGYARRLARVAIADEAYSADADRLSFELAYRVDLADGFSLGPLLGYELLRFEVDPRAEVLSVRYGALRVGAGVRQVFTEAPFAVALVGWGALRLSPSADVNTGFDLGVGPELAMDDRWFARLLGRWTHQAGDVLGGFEDQLIDFELQLGVLL